MRENAVRCSPDDRVADVLEAVWRSPYSFALVTDGQGMLLGRVRARRERDLDAVAGEVMELDPSTVRPHRSAAGLAQQLAERDQDWAIVTTPEGRLLGIAWREDLERAAG
jgi:CBS domain-containing protein